MNVLKIITGLALVSTSALVQAQSCAGHASTGAAGHDVASMVAKELALTPAQQTSFNEALASCEKDCAAMSVDVKAGEDMNKRKQARFNEALANIKNSLSPEQAQKLDGLDKRGKLAGLCSMGCEGGGKGCCAGKGGAKAQADAAPTKESGLQAAPVKERKKN